MTETLPLESDGSGRTAGKASDGGCAPQPRLRSHGTAETEAPGAGGLLLEIVLPVYNEESILEVSVRNLRAFLDASFPFPTVVTVVDNASTDCTWNIATRLTQELSGVTCLHLDQKGKGRAVRTAWNASPAQVVAYMDVDLSTGLDALHPLVAPLLSGHSHVSIGSRLAPGSRVLRGAKREVISRSYNLMLHGVLRNQFSDAQCGFKAMRRDAVDELLPLVGDEHWFFDTEMLVLAERHGMRIHEVPVDWIDDPDSRVHISGAMRQDLKGIGRLFRDRITGDRQAKAADATPRVPRAARTNHGELTRYAGVGILSTVVYLTLFWWLLNFLGLYSANAVAAIATTGANSYAHARFTFGAKGGDRLSDALLAGGVSVSIGVGLTTLALVIVTLLGRTTALAEMVAIVAGTLAASVARFLLLRSWAFREHGRVGDEAQTTA